MTFGGLDHSIDFMVRIVNYWSKQGWWISKMTTNFIKINKKNNNYVCFLEIMWRDEGNVLQFRYIYENNIGDEWRYQVKGYYGILISFFKICFGSNFVLLFIFLCVSLFVFFALFEIQKTRSHDGLQLVTSVTKFTIVINVYYYHKIFIQRG